LIPKEFSGALSRDETGKGFFRSPRQRSIERAREFSAALRTDFSALVTPQDGIRQVFFRSPRATDQLKGPKNFPQRCAQIFPQHWSRPKMESGKCFSAALEQPIN
jgi:broad specificity phosphatase PhoE